MNQDDVLRVRNDSEIHGAIINGEIWYNLISIKRNVKLVNDALLIFERLDQKPALSQFKDLPCKDQNEISKRELEALKEWFNKNIKQTLPVILSYSMSKQILLKLQKALNAGIPIIVTSGIDTDHSHILIEKELFGL